MGRHRLSYKFTEDTVVFKTWKSKMENKACVACGHRVPITLRDLFWQDPFFSTNWDDFHKIHDDMMAETRSIWQKFDQQLKHIEAKTPEPIPEDIKV